MLVKLDRVLESGAVGRVPVEHLFRPDYRRPCISFVQHGEGSFAGCSSCPAARSCYRKPPSLPRGRGTSQRIFGGRS